MSEGTDNALLERFEQEVWSKVPHLEEGSETKVVNATPLVDMTADFKECAKTVFKLDLDNADLKVFGHSLKSAVMSTSGVALTTFVSLPSSRCGTLLHTSCSKRSSSALSVPSDM